MWKVLRFLALLTAAVVLAACGGRNYGRDKIETEQEEDYLYLVENDNGEDECDENEREDEEEDVDMEAIRLAAIAAKPWDETTLSPQAAAYWLARMQAA